jgi:predicted alpha/beta hydrolase family esterase
MLNNNNFKEYLERPLADALIADISKVSRTTNRQIIFVAHGLGGSKLARIRVARM